MNEFELICEYGRYCVPDAGPKAAFRLMTLKELNAFQKCQHMKGSVLARSIIKRTLIEPDYKEYVSTKGVTPYTLEQVATEIVEASSPNSEEELERSIEAGKEAAGLWINTLALFCVDELHMDYDVVQSMDMEDISLLVGYIKNKQDEILQQSNRTTQKPQQQAGTQKAIERVRRRKEEHQAPVTQDEQVEQQRISGESPLSEEDRLAAIELMDMRRARYEKIKEQQAKHGSKVKIDEEYVLLDDEYMHAKKTRSGLESTYVGLMDNFRTAINYWRNNKDRSKLDLDYDRNTV